MNLWGGLANNPMYTGTEMGVDLAQKAMSAVVDKQKSTILYNDGGVVHLPDFPLVANADYTTKTPGLYLYNFSEYGFHIVKADSLHTKDGEEISGAVLSKQSPTQILISYTRDSLFADMPVVYVDITIVDTSILDVLSNTRLQEPVTFLYQFLQKIQHMERLPMNSHALVLYAPKSYICENLVAFTEAALGAPLSPVKGVVTEATDEYVKILGTGATETTKVSLNPYEGATSVKIGDKVEIYQPLVKFLSCNKRHN